MEWLRKLLPWAARTDPLLSWGERIVWLLVYGLGGGTFTGLAGIVIGFFTDNLLYGVVSGVVVGMLVLGGFTLKAISVATAATRTQTPEAEDSTSESTPPDADPHQAQQEELEVYRAEVASLEAQRDKLQNKVYAYDGDRAALKTLLNNAYTGGTSLRESKPGWEAADKWATTVSDLIRDAFGDTTVEVFMDDSEDRLAADRDATKEQAWLDNRLHRLDRLRQTLEFRDTVPFRSDFDPHDYDPATLLPKEASKDVFQDESIDIAQLTRRLGQIEGATGLRGLMFVGCTIYGPAILEHPHNVAPFDDCRWEPGGMRFWVVHPTERPPDGGAIKLENCIFRRCTFRHVGVLVNPEKFVVAELPSITR